MKYLVRVQAVLLASALSFPSSIADAGELPTVEEVVSRYTEAIGGAAALAGLQNRVTTSTLLIVDFGVRADVTTYLEPPNVFVHQVLDGLGTVDRGLINGVAWTDSFVGEEVFQDGPERAGLLQEASFNVYGNWQDFFEAASVIREVTIDGAPAYELEFTSDDLGPVLVFFDASSGLVVQTEQTASDGTTAITTIFEFIEVDGFVIPSGTLVVGDTGPRVEIFVESIEHNVDFPEDRFDLPEVIVGLLGVPIISGTVFGVGGGTPLEGARLSGTNGAGSDTTGADGAYSIVVPSGWSGEITVTMEDFLFTPPSRTYTGVLADLGQQDYEQLSAPDPDEGSGDSDEGSGDPDEGSGDPNEGSGDPNEGSGDTGDDGGGCPAGAGPTSGSNPSDGFWIALLIAAILGIPRKERPRTGVSLPR